MKTLSFRSQNPVGRFQLDLVNSSPEPMELGAVCGPLALAKMAAERLEYQRQGKCWNCGELGHIHVKCLTNPSWPLSITATTESESLVLGKGPA